MSSTTKLISILIILVLAEGAWIYFHDPRLNTAIKDNEQEKRDSIALGTAKYDSLTKVITFKDSKYDSLQKAKPPVEYHAYETIRYIDKSTVTSLDKFIRANWDTTTAGQHQVLHY